MNDVVPALESRGHSLWVSSCSHHSGMNLTEIYDEPTQLVPGGTGITMREAVETFAEGRRVVRKDEQPWPSNMACAF